MLTALSTNYLVARPFAALYRGVERLFSGGIASRSKSFSFGRLCSGAIWAVLFVTLITPAIGAIAQFGPFSWSPANTATHMFCLSGISGFISLALEKLVRGTGGWAGNASRVSDYSATNQSLVYW